MLEQTKGFLRVILPNGTELKFGTPPRAQAVGKTSLGSTDSFMYSTAYDEEVSVRMRVFDTNLFGRIRTIHPPSIAS